MKILEVVETWIRSFNPSEEDIKKAEYRAKICETCEFKQPLENSILIKLTETDKILNKFKCNKCGCVLSKKLFSYFKEGCEANKWKY